MLSAYIENKLSAGERRFIENHFAKCADCRKKFYEMSRIIGDLHYEYEKLMEELERSEAKNSNMKEYEDFYNNMALYADNELSYEDSIKFRKYLLKSKTARDELAGLYGLKELIRRSALDFKAKNRVNFARKVINRIKSENKKTVYDFYNKAAAAAGLTAAILAVCVILLAFNYYNETHAKNIPQNMHLKTEYSMQKNQE